MNALINHEDNDTILAVSPKALADARKCGKLDPGTEKLLIQEKQYIDKWREKNRDKYKDEKKSFSDDESPNEN